MTVFNHTVTLNSAQSVKVAKQKPKRVSFTAAESVSTVRNRFKSPPLLSLSTPSSLVVNRTATVSRTTGSGAGQAQVVSLAKQIAKAITVAQAQSVQLTKQIAKAVRFSSSQR